MRLTTILLAGGIALSSATSCRLPYLGPLTEYHTKIINERKSEPIRDDSRLGQYYLSGRYRKSPLKKEKKILSDLESRIELSMSKHFKREVDLISPYHRDLGHTVIVSNRGELKLRYEYHVLTKLSSSEQKALVYLAERRHLRGLYPVFSRTKNFKELARLMEKPKDKWRTEDFAKLKRLNRNFNIGAKPKFAASVGEIKGFAPYFIILLDVDPVNLYRMVNLWAHEGAHTLFFVGGGIYESMFRNLPINETACDLIGNRTAEQFRKDHLIKGSKLEQMFLKHKAFSEKYEQTIKDVAIMYSKFSVKDRRKKRDKIMEKLERFMAKRIGRPVRVNEARLLIWDRYSGNQKRYNMLDEIERIIGPNKFIRVVPKFRNNEELAKAHATFKKHGAKAFDTVMYELDKLHYVNREDVDFMF